MIRLTSILLIIAVATLFFVSTADAVMIFIEKMSNPIPEPIIMLLAGSGLIVLAGFMRKFIKS